MTPSKQRVLIVDDDRAFVDMLKEYLLAQGFAVDVAHHGLEMQAAVAGGWPDLIVLDLMMPGEDGLSLVRGLRAGGYGAPILMLSASADVVDRVAALETGADDYVCKPAHLREILARTRALLRRPHGQDSDAAGKETTAPPSEAETARHFGPYTLYPQSHRLLKGNAEISLTSAEFDLLLIFVTHPNRVLNRDVLMNLAKGYGHAPYDRSIDVRVSRLRNKLEDDPTSPGYIRTIRNEGYLFSPQG